jgi:asparagine N-glycosylation enzyme membrane subunit Stt3
MDDERVKISGEENKINIEEGKNIESKGDDNVIRIHDVEDVEVKGRDNIIKVEEKSDYKEFFEDSKSNIKNFFSFFTQKKTINFIIIILFLLLLVGSSWMRLQNLPHLRDSTTGEYIPLALDPFYFLRVVETMVAGDLPAYDAMRYPSLEVPFTTEFLPKAIVGLYKISDIFAGDISVRLIHVLSPVIFFILGLIAFFFLVYVLTKSKIAALVSAGFLAIIPSYIYRTLAGFADHESIGMFGFFTALLIYSLSLRFLNKDIKKKDLTKILLFSVLVGFFSAFTGLGWGGVGIFLFMIIPVSFLIFWLIKCQEKEREFPGKSLILFYGVWIIFSILSGLVLGSDLNSFLGRFILSSTGMVSLFVLGFVIIDYFLINNPKILRKITSLKRWPRQVYSLISTIILGIVALTISGKNVFLMIINIWKSLLHPFGLGRVGLTIAENAQPYLVDWISQIGKVLFWVFVLGLIIIGFEIARKIRSPKEKVIFMFTWIFMFSGILFSRISSSSALDGTNFLSQAFYLVGLILFVSYSAKLYFNKKLKMGPEIMIIASWMFFMLISGRSAIRFFFALTPFVAFITGYSIFKLFSYIKKSKEELSKMLLIIILLLVIVGLTISSITFIRTSSQQAKFTGPSANYQWQQAMSWVKDNTP